VTTELFGQGIKWPAEADEAGRLVTSEGDERIWESVQQILDTPRGTCPMDPEYGVDLDAYDPVSQPSEVGWRVARALERSEPRIAELEVAIIGTDPAKGLLELDIRIRPIRSNVRINRVFPLYRAN
jgi:phage baseplate assembly protein W